MTGADTSWVGVDLDGTLAFYDQWRGPKHIGDPIPEMVDRVKSWLAQGVEVKIFTARVGVSGERSNVSNAVADQQFADSQRLLIQAWCKKHIGKELEVTAQKDFRMVELWDDRAVQILPNTGLRLDIFRHQKLIEAAMSFRQNWIDVEDMAERDTGCKCEVCNLINAVDEMTANI